MFNLMGFALFILTVTMVTKSALAECSDTKPEYGFPDCGPIDNRDAYYMCCIRGDPHISTFDEIHYDLSKEGWFTAVLCSDLQIDVYVLPRGKNDKQYRARGIRIIKEGVTYEIKWSRKEKNLTVTSSNNVVSTPDLPYQDPNTQLAAWALPAPSNRVIIRCGDFRIVISCKFNTLYIWLSKAFIEENPTEGLCGIPNGDIDDDTDCVENCDDGYDDNTNCADNDEDCSDADFGDLWMVDHQGGGGGDGDSSDSSE